MPKKGSGNSAGCGAVGIESHADELFAGKKGEHKQQTKENSHKIAHFDVANDAQETCGDCQAKTGRHDKHENPMAEFWRGERGKLARKDMHVWFSGVDQKSKNKAANEYDNHFVRLDQRATHLLAHAFDTHINALQEDGQADHHHHCANDKAREQDGIKCRVRAKVNQKHHNGDRHDGKKSFF